MKFTDKIIKRYCITEKAATLSSNLNQYVFEVDKNVNRIEVAKAIEGLFNVTVTKVNILNKQGKAKRSRTQRGKVGRTASAKRAIVSLKEGDKIEMV
ncbi:MAG: 50S ribosomal protein L23 [Verrucomicrobia bacterium]|nr:MAG: 50S ribosomal protein L23 [Verrucomicrobiota bacterium]